MAVCICCKPRNRTLQTSEITVEVKINEKARLDIIHRIEFILLPSAKENLDSAQRPFLCQP